MKTIAFLTKQMFFKTVKKINDWKKRENPKRNRSMTNETKEFKKPNGSISSCVYIWQV